MSYMYVWFFLWQITLCIKKNLQFMQIYGCSILCAFWRKNEMLVLLTGGDDVIMTCCNAISNPPGRSVMSVWYPSALYILTQAFKLLHLKSIRRIIKILRSSQFLTAKNAEDIFLESVLNTESSMGSILYCKVNLIMNPMVCKYPIRS